MAPLLVGEAGAAGRLIETLVVMRFWSKRVPADVSPLVRLPCVTETALFEPPPTAVCPKMLEFWIWMLPLTDATRILSPRFVFRFQATHVGIERVHVGGVVHHDVVFRNEPHADTAAVVGRGNACAALGRARDLDFDLSLDLTRDRMIDDAFGNHDRMFAGGIVDADFDGAGRTAAELDRRAVGAVFDRPRNGIDAG
ncbi:MAG: hypothetical protein NVV63_14165 [Opitutus sp.]|nr:hypothetical protein [Opitutus sp.]